MDHDTNSQSNPRATIVLVTTVILFGVPCVGLLTFATDGAVLVIPIVVALVGIAGLAHYWLWGRAFSRQTEGEREEEKIREQIDTEEWDMPRPRNGHHG